MSDADSDASELSDDVVPFAAFWGEENDVLEDDVEGADPSCEERLACLTRTISDAGQMVQKARSLQGTRRFSIESPMSAAGKLRKAVKKIAVMRTLAQTADDNSIVCLLRDLTTRLDDKELLSTGILYLRDFVFSNSDDAEYAIHNGGITVAMRCLELFEDTELITVVSKVLNRLIPHGTELAPSLTEAILPAVSHILNTASMTLVLEVAGHIAYKLSLADSLCGKMCATGTAASLFQAALSEGVSLTLLHYAILAAANLCLSDTVEDLLASGLMAKLVLKCFRSISARPEVESHRRAGIVSLTPTLAPSMSFTEDCDMMPLSPLSSYLAKPTGMVLSETQSPPLPAALLSSPSSDFVLSPLTTPLSEGSKKAPTPMQLAESAVFCVQVVIEDEQSKIFIGEGMKVLADALCQFAREREMTHLNGLLDVIITLTAVSDPAVMAADLSVPMAACALIADVSELEVMRKFLAVFNNIAASAQNHSSVYQSAMWRPVLRVMNSTHDPAALQLCCTFLGVISSHDAEKLAESGCAVALLNAVRVLAPRSEEQDSAVFSLKQLAVSAEQRWNVLISQKEESSTSIKTLLHLLSKQSSNTKIVQLTTSALYEIAQVPYGRKQIALNAGIKVLLKATTTHLKVPSLRGRMVAIVVNVLHNAQQNQELVEHVVEAGVGVILSIISLCTESQLSHLTDCCIVLSLVTRHKEKYRAAVLEAAENVMSLLLLTVLPMYGHTPCVKWPLLVIGNLCQDGQACKDLLSYSGVDHLIEVLGRISSVEQVRPAVGWVLSRLLAYDESLKAPLEEEFVAITALSAGSTTRSYLDAAQRSMCTEAHELVTERKRQEDEAKRKQEEVKALELEQRQRDLQNQQLTLEQQKAELEKTLKCQKQTLEQEKAELEKTLNVQKQTLQAEKEELEKERMAVIQAEKKVRRMTIAAVSVGEEGSGKIPPWAALLGQGMSPCNRDRLSQLAAVRGDAGMLNITETDLADSGLGTKELKLLKHGIDDERQRRGLFQQFTFTGESELPFWLQASDISDTGKQQLLKLGAQLEKGVSSSTDDNPFDWMGSASNIWTSFTREQLSDAGVSEIDKAKYVRYAKFERQRRRSYTELSDEEEDEELAKLKQEVVRLRYEKNATEKRCSEVMGNLALREDERQELRRQAKDELRQQRLKYESAIKVLADERDTLSETVLELKEELRHYELLVRELPLSPEVGEPSLPLLKQVNDEKEKANSAEIQCQRYRHQIAVLKGETERMRTEYSKRTDNPYNLTRELYLRGQQLMLANRKYSNMIEEKLETEAVVAHLRNENEQLTKYKKELFQIKNSLHSEEAEALRESRERRDSGQGISRMERRLLTLGDLGIRAEKENRSLTATVEDMQGKLRSAVLRAKVAEEQHRNDAEALKWLETKFDMLKREENTLIVEHSKEVERVVKEVETQRQECDALHKQAASSKIDLEKERMLLMDTTNRLRAVMTEVINKNASRDAEKQRELTGLRGTVSRRQELCGTVEGLLKELSKVKMENASLRKEVYHRGCGACQRERTPSPSPKASAVKSRLKSARESSALLSTERTLQYSSEPQQTPPPVPSPTGKRQFDLKPHSILDTPYDSRKDRHLSAYHRKTKNSAKEFAELKLLLKDKAKKKALCMQRDTPSVRDWKKVVTLVDAEPAPEGTPTSVGA